MRFRSKTSRVGNQMNITPMIDIVFLLIIFFMVVSRFQTLELEAVELPNASKESTSDLDKTTRMIINVLANGDIVISRQPYSIAQLDAKFEEVCKLETRPEVLIRADRATAWPSVRDIMKMCIKRGIGQVDVAVSVDGAGGQATSESGAK
jgi:biopolymer transport protein ExbD